MLNLPLRPQVLFLSLLPPHLLVCRAEQALGSWRLCLLLQTAAETPKSQAGVWLHIPLLSLAPENLQQCPGDLMEICPCPLLAAVPRCVFTLQCWGSAGTVPAVFSPCCFSSGLLMRAGCFILSVQLWLCQVQAGQELWLLLLGCCSPVKPNHTGPCCSACILSPSCSSPALAQPNVRTI